MQKDEGGMVYGGGQGRVGQVIIDRRCVNIEIKGTLV